MCTITTKTALLWLQKQINNTRGCIRANRALKRNFRYRLNVQKTATLQTVTRKKMSTGHHAGSHWASSSGELPQTQTSETQGCGLATR